jgi:hypothetical protein
MMHSRRVTTIAVGALHVCTACYTYTPVHTPPAPGAQIALEVTDEGRVALNGTIGPGVVRLEGTLAGIEGGELLVDAQAVRQLRGSISDLGGVRVRLPQRYVTRMDERRFSRRKTFIVAGGIVAMVAAFFVTKGFGGRGTPPEGTGGGGPDQ